ncbi:MAG TPA: response regulator [Caldilineaceae bacterium]|nr:response regulator [Caldilineaceae bacterium]
MAHILIIEDDERICSAVADILELAGYETTTAPDGAAGVALARRRPPDLVICDIMMPYLDGYGVLQQLRQDAKTATIPFIFLTARTAKEDMRLGMALGADDYLTKPFGEEELLQAVKTRLDRQMRLNKALQSRLDALRLDIARTLPHELRTPLHGVLAGADYLRATCRTLSRDELYEMAELIYQAAERLERLVQNHLLYLELVMWAHEHGRAALGDEAVWTPVAPVVEMAARREATAAGREADLRLLLEDVEAPVDQVHLSKIVEELAGNAFKFSSLGTPVVLELRHNGDLCLSVTDQGRGMTAEQIQAVGAYVQFDRRRYEQPGVGLGLAIVQLLTRRYGGSVTIQSTPGRKTTVRVTLPFGKRA